MLSPALTHIHDTLMNIRDTVKQDIIWQDDLVEKLIVAVFTGWHVLIEWVPGLGKTKTIRTLARVLGMETKRISFTPDLLPSDLTGNEIYRPQKWEFIVRKWPIFTNILLADEINRTPPKVQSALLEAMEEHQVTIGEESFPLPSPFIVFATQNPLEHEGTYPLPEAELDRFIMRVVIHYPTKEDEKKVLQMSKTENINKVSLDITTKDIEEMREYIDGTILVDEKIYDYVCNLLDELRKLAETTSDWRILDYGPSTRAGLALIRAGKTYALLKGRDFVLPEDIKSLAHSVLEHRIWLSYTSLVEKKTPYQIIDSVLMTVSIP
jgi:MoxR-like ATPase